MRQIKITVDNVLLGPQVCVKDDVVEAEDDRAATLVKLNHAEFVAPVAVDVPQTPEPAPTPKDAAQKAVDPKAGAEKR